MSMPKDGYGYTLRELKEALLELPDDQLDLHATVYVASEDEFYVIQFTDKTPDDDRLGTEGHPYMVIDFPNPFDNESQISANLLCSDEEINRG